MIIDLHNHTKLCNHATGEIEQYIQVAIKNKTKFYGISDHAPMDYDEKYRMSFSQMDFYENMVLECKQKFSDQIEILLGYEIDYLNGHMSECLFNRKVDYLIGSVHFLNDWGFDNPEFIGEYKNRDIDDIWHEYFMAQIALAKSGKFDIVGHFDLIKIFNFMPKTDIRILAKQALSEIKKSNLVIEINSAGLRKPVKEQYPSREILELVFEMGIPITFGSDAHCPSQVGQNGDICVNLARSIGFNEAVCFKSRDRFNVKF